MGAVVEQEISCQSTGSPHDDATRAVIAAALADQIGVLRGVDGQDLGDWVWQNMCIRDGQFVAGYGWDSLIYAPEPAIAGLVAGAFTQGSPVPPHDPTPGEITGFFADYQAAARAFDPGELAVATAAATWVRCYNARCHLDNAHRRGMAAPPGAALEQLAAHHAS